MLIFMRIEVVINFIVVDTQWVCVIIIVVVVVVVVIIVITITLIMIILIINGTVTPMLILHISCNCISVVLGSCILT